MARPLRIEFAGAVYHVMSRGNARNEIFLGHQDYLRWEERLATTVEKFGVEIFASSLSNLVEYDLSSRSRFARQRV